MMIRVLMTWASVAVPAPQDGSCLRAPVDGQVVSAFVAPSCPYCAGHRTVDFDAVLGDEVVAPVGGTVTFIGRVAGRHYLTIAVSSGSLNARREHLVTIGGAMVDSTSTLTTGMAVEAGQVIARVNVAPIRLSVRRIVPGEQAEYVDPGPTLERWRAPVRLVPDPSRTEVARRRVTMRFGCTKPL